MFAITCTDGSMKLVVTGCWRCAFEHEKGCNYDIGNGNETELQKKVWKENTRWSLFFEPWKVDSRRQAVGRGHNEEAKQGGCRCRKRLRFSPACAIESASGSTVVHWGGRLLTGGRRPQASHTVRIFATQHSQTSSAASVFHDLLGRVFTVMSRIACRPVLSFCFCCCFCRRHVTQEHLFTL